MKSLGLLGKKYLDTIIYLNRIEHNETNECSKIIKRNGGINNFFYVKNYGLDISLYELGEKCAYILSEEDLSKRTSFVKTNQTSKISKSIINKINQVHDWVHVCYIDDLECYQQLKDINIPFSIDFCTNTDRDVYVDLMKQSTIIFDSRERKHLYKAVVIDTPIIFHDENGIEVCVNGMIDYEATMTPITNLNVNGAGDIYAACFIENYFLKDLKTSAKDAMIKTTKTLIGRDAE